MIFSDLLPYVQHIASYTIDKEDIVTAMAYVIVDISTLLAKKVTFELYGVYFSIH